MAKRSAGRYVDGFLLPVPKKNITLYRRMATIASKVWMKHGALEYREFLGDDLNVKGAMGMPRLVRAKRGETVVFSWILYKSRAHRNAVNARVMKDPRIVKMMSDPAMQKVFDFRRMGYGGFKILVSA